MVRLRNGDSRVVNIIRNNKLDMEREYRLSGWVFHTEKDGLVALRSSLSKQVYQLNLQEWAAVQRGDLSSLAAEELARQRILVEQDFDDLAQYSMVKNVLHSMKKDKPGIGTFIILPTTGCNARCVYCYQQGIEVRNMTREIADRVVEFICAVKRDGAIELQWFGGEPLCAPNIITGICRGPNLLLLTFLLLTF